MPLSARRAAGRRCSCRAQGPLSQARGPSAPKEISISRGLGPGPATSEVSRNSRKSRKSRKAMSLSMLGELRHVRAPRVARSSNGRRSKSKQRTPDRCNIRPPPRGGGRPLESTRWISSGGSRAAAHGGRTAARRTRNATTATGPPARGGQARGGERQRASDSVLPRGPYGSYPDDDQYPRKCAPASSREASIFGKARWCRHALCALSAYTGGRIVHGSISARRRWLRPARRRPGYARANRGTSAQHGCG